MQKNNLYFYPTNQKKLKEKFLLPASTITTFEQVQKDGNWRPVVLDRLKLYLQLEEDTVTKLKEVFSKKELQALWGSLKSTIIDYTSIDNPQLLAYGFVDYCIYEEMEAQQFGDIEALKKAMPQKLNTLSKWEVYCLLEYLQNDSEDIFKA